MYVDFFFFIKPLKLGVDDKALLQIGQSVEQYY